MPLPASLDNPSNTDETILPVENSDFTILVVDDLPEFRHFLFRSLQKEGYRVFEAETVSDAQTILDAEKIDVVLSDINMPGKDGLALLRDMKVTHPKVPLILITGKPSITTAIDAVHQGAFDYLQKPCPRVVMNETVARAIQKRALFLSEKKQLIEAQQAKRKFEEQFHHAKKMEAITKMAGGIAHDFNNLLTGIMGNADLAMDELEKNHPVREYMKDIMDIADRAADMTRQMLAFSRKRVSEPKVLNINALLENLRKLIGQMIGSSIELNMELNRHVGNIKVDPGQMEQAIINLVIHAKSVMPEGGQLSITTSEQDLKDDDFIMDSPVVAGKYVTVTIQDNALAMNNETRKNIFEPVFNNETLNMANGLGLSIVHGIVKQHNGDIDVTSQPGKGNTFTIYLPRTLEAIDPLAKQSRRDKFQRGTETILFVDDNETVRNAGVLLLKRLGYRVLDAEDAEQALSLADNYQLPIHLLFTDVMMPKMNGKELAAKFTEKRPECRVLYTSGYVDGDVIQKGILSEDAQILNKPFDISDLSVKVRAILDETDSNEFSGLNNGVKASGLPVSIVADSESGEIPQITLVDVVFGLNKAIDLVSPTLVDHHSKVAYIAGRIAEQMGLSERDQMDLILAGAIHDIGALATKDSFQSLAFETETITNHSEAGYLLLKDFPSLHDVARIVRCHHVKWNGGKNSDEASCESPVNSHILHLADRIAVQINEKEDILQQKTKICDNIRLRTGDMFVPSIVDAFLSLEQVQSFWLDIVTSPWSVLDRLTPLRTEYLDLDSLLDLGSMMAKLIDFRSRFTATHSSGVAESAFQLAQLAGFSNVEMKLIKIAGFFHDIGKLSVPNEILEKPGRLDEYDLYVMQKHPYYTHLILEALKGMQIVNKWASLHHERLDGEGYPFHMQANDLAMGSRIMAVADVFTAITEDRPYRKGMSDEKAIGVLTSMSENKALDTSVVNLLVENWENVNTARIHAQEQALILFQEVEELYKTPV